MQALTLAPIAASGLRGDPCSECNTACREKLITLGGLVATVKTPSEPRGRQGLIKQEDKDAMTELKPETRTELDAAVLRALLAHLDKRSDVQNIDLMNLAGFCRNCLSRWYREAAEERGLDLTMDEAREFVYGMSYGEWKEKYQKESSAEQQEAFKRVMADPDLTS